MSSFEGMDEASDEKTRDLHRELPLTSDVITQITTKQQVHHQVQVHIVLKRIVHINNELTLDHRQKFEFIHD